MAHRDEGDSAGLGDGGSRGVFREDGHLWFVDTVRGLDGKWVVAPARAAGPVRPASPDVRVGLHVIEEIVDGLEANLGTRNAELAEERLVVVILQPLSESGDSLDADGRTLDLVLVACRRSRSRNTGGTSNEVVQRIDNALHDECHSGVPYQFCNHEWRAGPGIAGNEDGIGGSSLTDGCDGRVRQRQPRSRSASDSARS